MIEILAPGALTTVQDGGRDGYMRFGVSHCGAMDATALAYANFLTGNAETEGALEATLITPAIRFTNDTLFAVTGGRCAPCLDSSPVPMDTAVFARAGQVLESASVTRGCRAYIAFAGGLSLKKALGSVSCDRKAAVGGTGRGEALKKGDTLEIQTPANFQSLAGRTLPGGLFEYLPREGQATLLRVTDGPQHGALTGAGRDMLFSSIYNVSPESDRMGIRFSGTKLPLAQGSGSMITDALCSGAIQTPPSGLPILMMADAQTTGGYPKPFCVISADMDTAAQLRPGDAVRFAYVSPDEARASLIAKRKLIMSAKNALAPKHMNVTVNGKRYKISVTEVFPY